MCGIAGLYSPSGATAEHNRIERTLQSLKHRGPDGFGVKHLGPALLLHTRLSIIDISAGSQPLCNEDGTVWVTFNGEIFNFVELRAELERLGHTFGTHSDTETLVHAYEEWGDNFVSRLNGQFAFAIWDSNRQRMLLVRDRTGIRPLFYSQVGERFYFASEAKAIAALSGQNLHLDARGLAQVFTFWSTVGEQTVFKGVRSLRPGHLLVLEQGRPLRISCYWDWLFPAASGVARMSAEDAAARLRELLIDAVNLQLRADVPVGAYLSGGLDSSGLVALARRNDDIQLRTFSVAFGDSEFDESAHQRRMSSFLGTDHSLVECTAASIAAIFPRLISHTETPILRTAPAPLMQLSDHVRASGFKVVLSGEGADEVFGGYDIFKEAKIRRFWARQPDSKWRPALFARLYPYLRNSPVTNQSFSRNFFGQDFQSTSNPFYSHIARWSTTRRTWSFLSPDLRAQLQGWSPEDDLRELMPSQMPQWEGLARDQYIEVCTLLHGYLLSSQGDRVAMANSVEGRVPYLDHRVIEFANQLPAKLKLKVLREKSVLRDALGSFLPGDIAQRTKQPYRAPDSASFFVNGRTLEYVDRQFSRKRLSQAGIFSPDVATLLFEKCRAGKAIGFADNMAFVGLLSTMLLEEQLIQGLAPG